MGVNMLGLVQGADALGGGLQSGYYGAIGNAVARNLAQQKQTSETNLQGAQANYFNGRNQTAQNVAQTRADGMGAVAGARTQAQMNIASMVAAGKLPQELAGQTPEAARGLIRQMDSLNPNSRLESSIYGSSPEGLPGTSSPAGSSAGGPGQAYLDPSSGGINFAPPGQQPSQAGLGGSAPANLPPSPTGGFGTSVPPAMSQGGLPAPQRSFMVPGVGAGAPMIGGVSGIGGSGGNPMPSGSSPAPAGIPSAVTSPLQNPQASGGAPMPPPSAAGNPFSPSPVALSIANRNNAQAQYTSGARTTLAGDQGARMLAEANLAIQNGKLVDAKTREVVPEAEAEIRLRNSQASAATANANSLPGFRAGLIANGATTANSNLIRSNTYAATQPIIAGADASRAASYGQGVNQTGQYQQGMLGVNQFRAANPAGRPGMLPSGMTQQQDAALARESQSNIDSSNTLAHMLQNNTDAKGNALGDGDKPRIQQQIQSLQDRNAEINRRRSQVMPMPIQGVGSQVPAGASAPYAPPLPGFSPNLPGASRPAASRRGKLNLSNFMP